MENAGNNGEFVSPQSIDEMNDEEFEAYIKSAEDGSLPNGNIPNGNLQSDKLSDGKSTDVAESADDAEPYMSFATKEALQEYQDKTIGSRLREIRQSKEEIDGIYELAMQRYDTADKKEAMHMLQSELSAECDMAEEYSASDKLRALQNEIGYQRRVNDIQNEWKRQASALKNIVPDFDLEQAFENRDFYNAVVENHMSITEAYPVLKKRSYNISEIGNITSGVNGYIKRDIASMSDKEFDDYIKKIKNS